MSKSSEEEKELRRKKTYEKQLLKDKERQLIREKRKEKQKIKDDDKLVYEIPENIDNLRTIKIITWGVNYLDKAPDESEHNYNVINISNKSDLKGFDTIKYNGRNKEIRNNIMSNAKAQELLKQIISDIEKYNFKCISLNCNKGEHKSPSMAIYIKENYYINAEIQHLTI